MDIHLHITFHLCRLCHLSGHQAESSKYRLSSAIMEPQVGELEAPLALTYRLEADREAQVAQSANQKTISRLLLGITQVLLTCMLVTRDMAHTQQHLTMEAILRHRLQ